MTVTLGIDIGFVNFSFCVLEQGDQGGQGHMILAWENLNILALAGFEPGFSCSKLTPTDIHNIAELLTAVHFGCRFLALHKIQHVAIEQQPHGKYGNMKMITLSHLLHSYFRRRILDTPPHEDCFLQTSTLMAASQKYQASFLNRFGLEKQKVYKNRKALGVRLMTLLLEELKISVVVGPLDKKKQDDFADSFLLAYSSMLLWTSWPHAGIQEVIGGGDGGQGRG